jgi:hypothetical protein
LDQQSGGYFWTGAIRGHRGAMSAAQCLLAIAWLSASPFCWACLLILGRSLYERGPIETFRSLFFLALVINVGIMTFLAAREGSTASYFLESCALGSIVIGLYALPFLREQRSRPRRIALLGLAAAVVAPSLFGVACWPGAFTVMPAANAAEAGKYIAAAPSDRELIADGEWVPWVVGAGRVPAINDPFTMRMLLDQGAVDPAPLVNAIEQGRIELLVMWRSIDEYRVGLLRRWPAVILDSMERNFTPVAAKPGLYIYRHRRRLPSRTSAKHPAPLGRLTGLARRPRPCRHAAYPAKILWS